MKFSRRGFAFRRYRECPLASGSAKANLKFELIKGGIVGGRAINFNGQPASNVQVTALTLTYVEGRRTLRNVKADRTDDRGEFRLFRLGPGEYYIRSDMLSAYGLTSANPEMIVRTYFPAAMDVSPVCGKHWLKSSVPGLPGPRAI
jgi:hypothetical protein